MSFRLPSHLLLGILAGWLNRHQQVVIEYLKSENEILKRQLNGRRLKLTDGERRLLAVKGKALGRRALEAVAGIATPDTILAWHRRLVAMKWTFPSRGPGRPPVSPEIRNLILEMARSSPRWGYTSIQDRLRNLGYRVGRTTVARILKEHGLEPAPKRSRGMSWTAFLKAQWTGIAAIDFTTVEVWTAGGLVTYYVAFVMELATRRVTCAGITAHPGGAWMEQVGRNLTDAVSGFLTGKKFLIMDRDVLFHAGFRRVLEQVGVKPVRTPPRAPNCNAYLERFHGSFKREAANRVIFFGEPHLRRVVDEYLAHYHQERNHQGCEGKIIEPGEEFGLAEGRICRRERLGGMFNYYYGEDADRDMRPTEETAKVLTNDERRRRVAELLCKAISLSEAKRVVETPPSSGEVVVSTPVTTTPGDVGSDEHRILDYLELAGRGSPAAIREALGLSRSATYRALHRLTVVGHIRPGGKTRGLAYQLNDAEPPPHKIALN